MVLTGHRPTPVVGQPVLPGTGPDLPELTTTCPGQRWDGQRRSTSRAGAPRRAAAMPPGVKPAAGPRMEERAQQVPASTGTVPKSTPAGDVRDALAYDRTHLANERTFAAWLRTGLSVAAGGIAVAHMVPEPARDSWIALLLGAAFVLLGIAVIAYGAREFARVAEELSHDSGRRSPAATRTVYGLTSVIGVLLVAVLLFLWSHRGTVRSEAHPAGSGSGGEVMPSPRTP